MVGVVKSAHAPISICWIGYFHEVFFFKHDYGGDKNAKSNKSGNNGTEEIGASSLGLRNW